MTLHDALFNWLQMKIVCTARPDDRAARDTLDFFEQILREDHRLTAFDVAEEDDAAIHVQYTVSGKENWQRFDRELAEKLLEDINSNPKYNQ